MDKRIWSLLAAVVLSMALVASLGVGGCTEEKEPRWTNAIEMMDLLPSEIDGFKYIDVTRADSDVIDQMKTKMQWPTDDFYGQDWDKIDSLGFCSSHNDYRPKSLMVYEGAFDATSMASALEGEAGFGPASRYGSILLWTIDQGTLALIDRFIVAGHTERVQHCIEAAQGEREPLSDNEDASDVLLRLPEDQAFSLAVGDAATGENAGCLAQALTFRPALTFTSTIVEKYEDVDSARARVAHLKGEGVHKISRDGVFVIWTSVFDHRNW